MKAILFYLLCATSLTAANRISGFRANLDSVLNIRDIAYLATRTNNGRGDRSRGSQRESLPAASVSVKGPAKIFANGPGSKNTWVGQDQSKMISSHHPTNPYVDGRLVGDADRQSVNLEPGSHPMKAMAKGRAATAQVTVPDGGHGTLRVKNGKEDQTLQVAGPDSRKLHIQSDSSDSARAYASVTRPGAVNVDAEK